MIIVRNYVGVLRKYAVFRGRATLSEYWWFALAHFVALIALNILGRIGSPEDFPWILPFYLYYLGTIIPFLALTVRRFHDRGHSGWMILLGLLGWFIVLIFMALPSERRDNKHGPYPHWTRA